MDPKQVQSLNAMVTAAHASTMAQLHQPQRGADETKLQYIERRLNSRRRAQAITAHPKALFAKTVTLSFTDGRAVASDQKRDRRQMVKAMGIRQYKKQVRHMRAMSA